VNEEACGIRLIMKDVRDATARILDSTSLAELNASVALVEQGGPPELTRKSE
jgi:DNA-binding IscR family transcriptional regulator